MNHGPFKENLKPIKSEIFEKQSIWKMGCQVALGWIGAETRLMGCDKARTSDLVTVYIPEKYYMYQHI